MFAHEPSPEDLRFLQEKEFEEPNHPYVLFRRKFAEQLDYKTKHQKEPGDYKGLRVYENYVVLNVAGCHKQWDKIDNRFIKLKNMRVITWGNFPKPNSLLAKALMDEKGRSPWDELAEKLEAEVSREGYKAKEISDLEKRLQEKEKLIAELTNGKHDKAK